MCGCEEKEERVEGLRRQKVKKRNKGTLSCIMQEALVFTHTKSLLAGKQRTGGGEHTEGEVEVNAVFFILVVHFLDNITHIGLVLPLLDRDVE